MERIRQAVTGGEKGRGLPDLEEERMRGAGGGMGGRATGREYGREGGGLGGAGGRGGAQPGELPGLTEGGEAGWERKEGGAYGYGGEGGWGAEEETGVPAGTRGREKMPADATDFWNDWKFGLTYNNEEWGDGFFWRAVFAEGCATTAFTYFLLSVGCRICPKGSSLGGLIDSPIRSKLPQTPNRRGSASRTAA